MFSQRGKVIFVSVKACFLNSKDSGKFDYSVIVVLEKVIVFFGREVSFFCEFGNSDG